MATTTPPPVDEPTAATKSGKIRFPALVRAIGGPRYAFAVGVDAIGTGMLRPFLLLYGIGVLRLAPPVAGLAMTVGVVAGLAGNPLMGRWLDRGARSTAVAAAMFVRVIGAALLLAAPAGTSATVWVFILASLVFGVGNQTGRVAHTALIATVSTGRARDAALAASYSLRNAGLGLGALVATAGLTGGTAALRELAIGTAAAYLVATVLTWSVRIRADGPADAAQDAASGAVPRMGRLLVANVVFVFVLSVPEVALPLVLVTVLHAAAVWAAVVFVANTVLVVVLAVPVTRWMARFSRQTALAISGIVIAVSYLGFLGAVALGHGWAAPAIAAVSVLATLGEIIYAGSSTALVVAMAPERVLGRALGRFTLSTGVSLAVAPAVITALAAHGEAALWLPLAAATLLASAVLPR